MAAVWKRGRRAFAMRGRSAVFRLFDEPVFLPQVAPEQGWDVPTMLTHLSLKADLGPGDRKSGASFETFRAQVFNRRERKVK